MRKLLIALAIMLVSAQAHAQMGGGKHRGGGRQTSAGDADKQKRMAKEEAAAKAAMKTVPDSTEKYDPWKIGK
ncbi:hypothetical protein [Bradyrhizobium sp. SYSU BS000235]|jgi:hypothetical protein|uniref:hypothetical protein n=1 Tax=Bradyrhizobium sp. SYSU BS000235 TaxID=3411332 RepID=UPI003C76DC60